MRRHPPKPPDVPGLRRLLAAACDGLAATLGRGGDPLDQAPQPDSAPVPDWSHWHHEPELFIQLSGATRFLAPGGDLHLPVGRALIFPPRSAHSERPERTFSNLVILFRGRFLQYHLAMEGPERPFIAAVDVLEGDGFGLPCLVSLAQATAPGLRRSLFTTFCAWTAATARAAPLPGSGGSERVRRARELIEARLGSPQLAVAQLAAWLGCHPDHLARQFRRETGETLVGHIVRRRLETARDLLAGPGAGVAEVARRVGFTDPAYFSRVWRKHHGGPPSAFRSNLPQ